MGLKLKTQIAGILFLLFTLTILIIGYFNMSILYDVMKSLSEEQSRNVATQVTAWAERTLPQDGYTEQFLRLRNAQTSDFSDFFSQFRGLRSFQIFDINGHELWSWGRDDEFPRHSEAVAQALSGRPYQLLWEYSSENDTIGRPLDGQGSLAMSRHVAFVYYRAVVGQVTRPPVAVFRVSVSVEEMTRRLRLMLLGNAILSGIFLITAFVAISIWTANAINRPLEFILQGQERIGRGDFSAHVSVDIPSTNEIVTISNSFNQMAADLRRFKKELEIKTVRLERLNLEYKRLNEHLESEVENKTLELKEFFSVVTHDMKVPLAAIQGYADLLIRSRNNPLTHKQLRFVRGVSSAFAHLLGMTRNMLESVKYDAGRVPYFMENFDLGDAVEEVGTQIKQQADEKGLQIRWDVPPLCRTVLGDRTKIVQVLSNLVNNAVKFTPEGGVIEVRARDRGPLVEVEVADSGVGIAEDQVPHLFEKFTQFHTEEGQASSIGLGLYIVQKILEGHGQPITVESRPGAGSTFTFTLAKGTQTALAESLDTLVPAHGSEKGEED